MDGEMEIDIADALEIVENSHRRLNRHVHNEQKEIAIMLGQLTRAVLLLVKLEMQNKQEEQNGQS